MFKTILKFICVLTILAGFSSCNKEKGESSDQFHITMKLDNDAKSFSSAVSAEKHQFSSGDFRMIILGGEGKSTFGISIASENDFKAGDTFTYGNDDLNSALNGFTYAENIENMSEATIWGSDWTETPEVHITITEITDKFVKGTFSGRVYQTTENGSSKVITNGSFKGRF